MTTPQSGAELLARIRPTLREESTKICLRPDLIEAWQEADAELQELVAENGRRQGGRLAADDGQRERDEAQHALAEMVQSLEEQIESSSAVFRLRAMSKDEWRALCDDNPPRKNNELDLYVGYNRDAVLDRAVRKSLVDPEFDDESWADLVAVINGGEWEELRKVANSVNRGVNESPKSVLASRILTSRGAASKPPVPSE